MPAEEPVVAGLNSGGRRSRTSSRRSVRLDPEAVLPEPHVRVWTDEVHPRLRQPEDRSPIVEQMLVQDERTVGRGRSGQRRPREPRLLIGSRLWRPEADPTLQPGSRTTRHPEAWSPVRRRSTVPGGRAHAQRPSQRFGADHTREGLATVSDTTRMKNSGGLRRTSSRRFRSRERLQAASSTLSEEQGLRVGDQASSAWIGVGSAPSTRPPAAAALHRHFMGFP